MTQQRCERAGILTHYRACEGNWQSIPEETQRRLLQILGDTPFHDPGLELREAGSGARAGTSCLSYAERCGDRPSLGLWLNLYSLRGARDFGIGNLSHVSELAGWAADLGVDFIGLSPMHDLRNQLPEISPYSPRSRLFLNSIYIDPLAVPEFRECAEARAFLDRPDTAKCWRALSLRDRVDYEASMDLLRGIFERLCLQFSRVLTHPEHPRTRAFRAFVAERDPLLTDYATFICLENALGNPNCREWPAEFRDPRDPAVAKFRAEHRDEVQLHRYLQFEVERQLAAAQERARAAGMRIGLYRDLALSSRPNSFDSWVYPDLFVSSARLGAPPDGYAAGGQDWALPPLHPRALSGEHAHPYFLNLLDTNLRHAGALRIDHVMGLFRQYWIPAGLPAREGGYVLYPGMSLLHHIGIKSREHGALIVGEDLGTVPDDLPPKMRAANMLSCKVFFFEREPSGEFRPPEAYAPEALVTATTHDFPTLAGYLAGRDLEISHELGWLDADQLGAERRGRANDVARLARYLGQVGTWPEGASLEQAPPLTFARALYLALRRTPARLLGVGLDNLAGEAEPVNVPGVGVSDYPSWTRRMQRSVDELTRDPSIAAVLRELAATAR